MRVISTLKHGRMLSGIDKLTSNDVLHITDQFDRPTVDLLLKKGTPNCIVSDHYTSAPFVDTIKFYGLPLCAARDIKLITNKVHFDNTMSTVNCFNFMINKKQINRYLCIKFVEYFKLDNFDYTWSAVDQRFDMSEILQELQMLGSYSPLDEQAKSFILSPIQLEKRFIAFGDDTPSSFSIPSKGEYAWIWTNVMQQLFLNSAISLITESVQYQKAAMFSEKTMYSVLGLTFPIWIGGYNQASEWKKLGFDIFDDVINHNYQSYETLIERCYYAFADNIELLADKNKSAELRLVNKERLLNNRKLLLENQLGNWINHEINKYPTDLQVAMPEILNYFGF